MKVAGSCNPVKQVLADGREIADKKGLCERLGWSRPTLDRRLRADENFPVLQCGKPGIEWQFDVAAVIAHLALAPDLKSLNRNLGRSTGKTPPEAAREIRIEIAKVQALRRVIEALVIELGVALDRLATSLGHEGLATCEHEGATANGPTH